jgi:anti-sigma regulatory factor (Ser/Thr protein kinase)
MIDPDSDSARSLRLQLDNQASEIDRAAPWIEQFLTDENVEAIVADGLILAASDIMTRILTHGFTILKGTEMIVEVRVDGSEVELVIEDDGPPFNPLATAAEPSHDQDAEHDPTGAMTARFLDDLTDEAFYERPGDINRVTLRKKSGDRDG